MDAKPLSMRSSMLGSRVGAVKPSMTSSRLCSVRNRGVVVMKSRSQVGRWKGMDAGHDTSDDQQDIARGRDMVDSVFQGGFGQGGTHNAIMNSGDYINAAQRDFSNIEDGFYIAPAFLDKLTIHVAKNFMDLPKIKVPLILGIWGGKGQGKTFQCNLAFKKLGISPIVMSAGELESGNAGEPAKLVRQRYREASDIISKKGRMCALFINDLDAGAGRMGLGTQYTVNNQMVNATLMNIADNPTNVQLPGVYNTEEIPRVPIICTGNDFSTLYAPLIRDGRMEKYYWAPTREDRIGISVGIFKEDNVSRADVERLVDEFPGQSIDFFGALRARVYDDKVRDFVTDIGVENMGNRLVNSREGKVTFEKPAMPIEVLLQYGNMLVEEQDNVRRVQLADSYLESADLAGSSGTSLPEAVKGSGFAPPRHAVEDRSAPPPPSYSEPARNNSTPVPEPVRNNSSPLPPPPSNPPPSPRKKSSAEAQAAARRSQGRSRSAPAKKSVESYTPPPLPQAAAVERSTLPPPPSNPPPSPRGRSSAEAQAAARRSQGRSRSAPAKKSVGSYSPPPPLPRAAAVERSTLPPPPSNPPPSPRGRSSAEAQAAARRSQGRSRSAPVKKSVDSYSPPPPLASHPEAVENTTSLPPPPSNPPPSPRRRSSAEAQAAARRSQGRSRSAPAHAPEVALNGNGSSPSRSPVTPFFG